MNSEFEVLIGAKVIKLDIVHGIKIYFDNGYVLDGHQYETYISKYDCDKR